MRILICSNAYPPHFMGGAELIAYEQARILAQFGHDVYVFAGELNTFKPRHIRIDDLYESTPVCRVVTASEDYSPDFVNFFHPEIDNHFTDVVSEFRPDIVHFHNIIGLSVKLPLLARREGVRTICTLHDFWGFCLRNTALRPDGRQCEDASQCVSCLTRIHDGRGLHVPMRFRKDFIRLALDHVERFIAPSQHIADRYIEQGLATDRLVVIRNGIDIDRFHPGLAPFSPSKVRITYAGYFGAHKGVATLLDAMNLLLSDGLQVALQLVGDGPERDAYWSQITGAGLQEAVSFLGKVPTSAMPAIYGQSDIVVLPSIWSENQPVCIMEAMAAGVPVVASRMGGIPELIHHGDNGLMFAAGDARELAAQLARLIRDPALRQAIGRRGRRCVADFSHTRQTRRQLDAYTELIHRAPLPIPSPNLYVAAGGLRRRMAGIDTCLADGRYPSRYFMLRQWVADCSFPVRGVILTGRVWAVLRLLHVRAIFPVASWFAGFIGLTRRRP